jgi:retron-type reverse transcriptase
MAYRLTRDALMLDLYAAFICAKRHKAKKPYVLHFERNLKENIDSLCDDLWTRRYKPEPSTCFVIQRPKKREVFAAQFRDRIVHHLYYNYMHELFERTFIQDTYSCIPGRGTHYGIERMEQHIRQESRNWQRPCYALKIDIRGYFMNVNRRRLLDIATASLTKMADHQANGGMKWRDVIDMDFILWLTHEIVLLDPTDGCRHVGNSSEWDDVDASKLMANAPADCGMPIGNLTSQLFSNVYMNPFDQMVKRLLHFLHYGRYVDDSATISSDRQRLTDAIPVMRDFLKEELCLDMHMGKTQIIDVRYGVEFLGAFIKPYRTYICNRSLSRIRQEAADVMHMGRGQAFRTVNSLLGVMSHYSSYNLRREIFTQQHILRYGTFDREMTTFTLSKPVTAMCA